MSGSGIKSRGEEARQALLQLLDAYGADPARWPAEDPRRAKAWTLIDSGDAMAAQSVAAARALDRALDTMAAPAPSAALTGAILQAAQKPGPGFRSWAGLLRKPALLKPALLKPVGALACAGLLGIMVGVWSPVPVAGIGDRQMAGLETELASLGALDVNGDDNAFGEFAE